MAREPPHVTHGHEQLGGSLPEGVGALGGAGQRGKTQDNYNSIMNKI